MTKHIVIPLRKDSVSTPNKNINILGDRHLFRWRFDEILTSNTSNDYIWIATNIIEVNNIIGKYYPNNENISVFWRSEENATNVSPTIDVVNELIENNHFSPDD